MSLELVRRAHVQGYAGGKSALYALLQELRPRRPRPIVHFGGRPGEFFQHDFGPVEVRFLDGSEQRVHFLASRLKYSRWVQVSLVEDERVESPCAAGCHTPACSANLKSWVGRNGQSRRNGAYLSCAP